MGSACPTAAAAAAPLPPEVWARGLLPPRPAVQHSLPAPATAACLGKVWSMQKRSAWGICLTSWPRLSRNERACASCRRSLPGLCRQTCRLRA